MKRFLASVDIGALLELRFRQSALALIALTALLVQPTQSRVSQPTVDYAIQIKGSTGGTGGATGWIGGATGGGSQTGGQGGSEVAAQSSFELGRIYEAAGRLKEAESAYAKALITSNASLRQQASRALEHVLRKQDRMVARVLSWTGTLFEPLLRAAVRGIAVIVVILLVRPGFIRLGEWRGRNQLGVGVTDSTEQKLGASFADVIKLTRERMDYYFSHADVVSGNVPARATRDEGPRLPIIVRTQDVALVELVESSFEGPAGKIGSYLAKSLIRPEFTLHATITSADHAVNIIASLERRDKVCWTWDVVSFTWAYFRAERDLALQILKYLQEYEDAR